MTLNLLKILTVLSFLLIMFETDHLGGFFGTFLLLGMMAGGVTTLISILYVLILVLFLLSILKPFSKKNFYLFFIGGLILLFPIAQHLYAVIAYNNHDYMFIITSGIFTIIYGFTLFKIKWG